MEFADAYNLILKIEKVICKEVRKARHSVQGITAYANIEDTISVYRTAEGDFKRPASLKEEIFGVYRDKPTPPKDRGFLGRLFTKKETPKAKSEITFFVYIKGRISNYKREKIIREIEERLAELDIQKPDMEIRIYLE